MGKAAKAKKTQTGGNPVAETAVGVKKAPKSEEKTAGKGKTNQKQAPAGKATNAGKRAATKAPAKVSAIDAINAFKTSTDALRWLLSPVDLDEFFKNTWEKTYLHIKRNDTAYYEGLFGKDMLKKMAKDNELFFERDVNACRYVNGAREGMNAEGEFTPKHVDSLFAKKATLQVHQPQRYVDGLHALLYRLESYFGCLVGANSYLTPPAAQGLAPHNDDVDVFILQLEGSKHWKLYKPQQELARDYSPDLEQDEIGDPILDVVVEQGDLLYFPRGTIHQACVEATGAKEHSTHMTISLYQRQAWGDFLGHVLPKALETAIEEDVELRSGLPFDLQFRLGSGLPDTAKLAKDIKERVLALARKVVESHVTDLVLNDAADAYMHDFVKNRLPPPATPEEKEEEFVRLPQLTDKVRIKYPEACRLLVTNEEDPEGEPYVLLAHCLENDRESHMMGADDDDEEHGGGCCDDGECGGGHAHMMESDSEGSEGVEDEQMEGDGEDEEMEEGEEEEEEEDSNAPEEGSLEDVQHGRGFLRFGNTQYVEGIRQLLKPGFTVVDKLPLPTEESKRMLVNVLAMVGLLEFAP